MKRRQFLGSVAMGSVLAGSSGGSAGQAGVSPQETSPVPIAASDSVVYESPAPDVVYAYSPGIALLPSGRLVATMDQGVRDVTAVPGMRIDPDGRMWRGKIYTSDDHGLTWTHRSDMPLYHARPFAAGSAVYIIGHSRDLGVMRSTDGGNTWDGPFWFTQGEVWHQAPCNVLYKNGRVYLVMERVTQSTGHWPVAVIAPVVMRASVDADLTKRASWTFSNELTFNEAVAQAGKPNLIGVPFYKTGNTVSDASMDRVMHPIGWLETNMVEFTDPDHVWHDPAGRTFYLWMRAHTGSTGLACIAKVTEGDDDTLTVGVAEAPSGEPMVYVPCPGGQMKFHILFDERTKRFWLLSTQATDSMCRADRMPENRYNLPNNERHRLVLYFSKNCVDWCFAARIADTGEYGQGRHYASMVIDGDDLHVLSRSGDHRAKSAHDGNLITLHTVRDFRELVY